MLAKIVIIGGGVIGSSIAYHLAQAGYAGDVVVLEPDPTYEFAATPRATGGIRQLYTVPENIRMSQYGHEIYGQLERMPLTRHISGNVSFRPQGAGYICGNTTYDEPHGFYWEIDYSFFDEAIWPGLAERVPAFEALKVKSTWAGHYDENTLDNNAILGPWVGGLENFHIALGFSGHGLMQAPAVGRGLSELFLHGRYQPLDLSRLGYQRILDGMPLRDEVPKP